ncbi:hypothetical protein ACHAWF_014364, partial [Thalassiosira exigua]
EWGQQGFEVPTRTRAVVAADVVILLYYAAVAEPITTVAHLCAVVTGALLWRIAAGARRLESRLTNVLTSLCGQLLGYDPLPARAQNRAQMFRGGVTASASRYGTRRSHRFATVDEVDAAFSRRGTAPGVRGFCAACQCFVESTRPLPRVDRTTLDRDPPQCVVASSCTSFGHRTHLARPCGRQGLPGVRRNAEWRDTLGARFRPKKGERPRAGIDLGAEEQRFQFAVASPTIASAIDDDSSHDDSSQDEGGSDDMGPISDFEDETSQFVQTNPMMERIRSTLYQQLLQTRDRVRLELREQEEALKETKKAREDKGIELYGMQQQLSRLQSNLRAVDQRYEEASQERVEGRDRVAEAKRRCADKAREADELKKESARAREELDALLEKIRQARKYNDATKSELALTRTVANKTGEDFKARARGKTDQDAYIDGLNRQVTRLEDEIALAEAQLKAQKEQSVNADTMIRETSGALEKLAGEQRRLVQQWNSSVVALGRRDQALSVATKALRKVQDSIQDLDNENARLERDIGTLQESNEGMKVSSDRLDNEVVFTENNIARVQANLGSLSETFEMLQESLKNTNQEEKALASEVSKIESEISTVNHKCELLIRERHAIEEKISAMRHEQTSMSKVAQNLAREEKSVLAKIHDKEIEGATVLNEIARLDIDRLNTQAHNSQLEEKLGEELAALNDAEARIDEQEGEIRRCNDEIEKKTMRVAKLNREYNKMVAECDDEEPLGPLEATIKGLSKEIEEETNEIRNLQREWLLRQTELIKAIGKTNSVQEKDAESTGRLGIIRQKLLRLVQEIHTNESSLRSIEHKTRGLHTDITRLNDLIEQNSRRQAEYANKIAVNAMEFERELTELDQESARLESQIAEVQCNKKKMSHEIHDIEEQLKVWEKKIQVEKETQEELHTSKDAIDTKGMEKEIQRMKYRLESLVRTQEQLLRDVELAIHKREDIAVKYKNTKYSGKDSRQQNLTKGELAKKVGQANSKLRKLEDNIRVATRSVDIAREDLSEIQRVLKDAMTKFDSCSKQRQRLEREANESEFEKNRLRSMCDLHVELLKRYESLSKGDVPPVNVSARTEFEVDKKMIASKGKMDKISNIITGLALKFDQYEDIFDRMNLLATPDIISTES